MTDNIKKKKSFYLGKFSFTRKSPGLYKHMSNRGLKDVNIISQWDKIVGIGLSKYSIPEKVNNITGKKILSVFVFETRIIEYQHQKQDIISRINLTAGYNFIDDIKFIRTRKIPKSKYQPKRIITSLPKSPHPYLENKPKLCHDSLQKAFEKLAHSVIPVAKVEKKEEISKSKKWRIQAKDMF